ncbi:hypothetical protein GWK36_08010 [Caldichromatium japonicum]|uniref:Uncharacterized protein n=1 Tax=Caldichromatium japonicum TaxID=2699430 RepID=A0A6G7VDI4_9GAMM|nr:hypothetical protein GWK36_08010 [Caldichromatium japonicum]
MNIEILEKANSPSARAVIAFLKQHNPQTASQHSGIARHLEGLLEGGNLIFQVRGKNVLDDPEIRRVWEESRTGRQATEMQCLVTRQKEPVARLHPDIKGVP